MNSSRTAFWGRHQRGRPIDSDATQALREVVLTRLRADDAAADAVTVDDLWGARSTAGGSTPPVFLVDVETWPARPGEIIQRPWGWQLPLSTYVGSGGIAPVGGGGGYLVDARRAEVHRYGASTPDVFAVAELETVEEFERFRALRVGVDTSLST